MAKTKKPTTKEKPKLKRNISYPLPEKIVAETRKKTKKHTSDYSDDDAIAKANKSLFAKKLKEIRKANVAHNYDETARLVVSKSMLDMILDLIPIAETNYRQYKQDRSAYALNTYVNQARELQNDMRSMQDFGAQLDIIVQLMRKTMSLIAGNLVDETYSTKISLRDNVSNPKALKAAQNKLDKMMKSHGRFMQDALQAFTDELTALLMAPEPDQRKKKKSTIVKGGPN